MLVKALLLDRLMSCLGIVSANTFVTSWPVGIVYVSKGIGTVMRGIILWPGGIGLYHIGIA